MPRATDAFKLIVSLVDGEGSEHRVDWCRVNDGLVSPRDTVRYHTLAGINSEIVFDVSGHLRDGRNRFTCGISGHGAFFDLDVYEVRSR